MSTEKIIDVKLDEKSVVRRSPDVEKERAIAIYDLLEENYFSLTDGDQTGPYTLHLSIQDNRLVFDIHNEADGPIVEKALAVSPFRSIVKDYFTVCDSYYAAIKTSTPAQIEAIDMGRRGLHDEGADLLRDRLGDKGITIDKDTARRLFTLVCVLHIRA